MRVKMVETNNIYRLEETINSILETYKNDKVIDIKYSGNGNHSTYSVDRYSAMIIFK